MDIQRAKEIVDSLSMITVTYEGKPIFIQQVHEESDSARVFPIDHPQQEQEVPLESLQEQ
ncbi:H-type small acid-soluble spore protein [Aquibacillus kalidii]|uniref:H-type small acid-soluble spore protein n=1 Tax=Aquibacillus kalidii TaxID=2762597 RepID=UPI0016459948|nr:H-type small acid-soluble spore protein [Aquibacillus kalidii]